MCTRQLFKANFTEVLQLPQINKRKHKISQALLICSQSSVYKREGKTVTRYIILESISRKKLSSHLRIKDQFSHKTNQLCHQSFIYNSDKRQFFFVVLYEFLPISRFLYYTKECTQLYLHRLLRQLKKGVNQYASLYLLPRHHFTPEVNKISKIMKVSIKFRRVRI